MQSIEITVFGIFELRTSDAAFPSIWKLNSPKNEKRMNFNVPPMITNSLRFSINVSSNIIAVATLVRGPTVNSEISPGFYLMVSIKYSTAGLLTPSSAFDAAP